MLPVGWGAFGPQGWTDLSSDPRSILGPAGGSATRRALAVEQGRSAEGLGPDGEAAEGLLPDGEGAVGMNLTGLQQSS